MELPRFISDRPGTSTSGMRRILTFVVSEEVDKLWSYHWSSINQQPYALCGKDTMPANIQPDHWGESHPQLEVRWCEECQKIKQRIFP